MQNTSSDASSADEGQVGYRTFHYQLSDSLLLTNIVSVDGSEMLRFDLVSDTAWSTIQQIVSDSIPPRVLVKSHVHDLREGLHAVMTAIVGQAGFNAASAEVMN